jgi:hypothetical protein
MIVKGLENSDTMRQIYNAHDFTTGMHRQLRHCSCVEEKKNKLGDEIMQLLSTVS